MGFKRQCSLHVSTPTVSRSIVLGCSGENCYLRFSTAQPRCRNGIVAIFELWRCPSDGLLVLRRRFARSAVSPISLAPSTLFYPARLGPVQRLAAPELRTAMEEAGFVRVVMKAQPVSFGASQDGTFKSHLGSSQSYADGSCGP